MHFAAERNYLSLDVDHEFYHLVERVPPEQFKILKGQRRGWYDYWSVHKS